MQLTVTEAAKKWGISKQYIYKRVRNGDLSRLTNKKIDVSEMVRVFGEPKAESKQVVNNDAISLQLEVNSLHAQIRQLEGHLDHSKEVQMRLLEQVDDANKKMVSLLEYQKKADKPKRDVWVYIVIFLLILVVTGSAVAFLNGYKV